MKKNILIAASMLFFVLACQKEVIENNISGTKSIDAEVEIINETKTSFNPSESSTGPRSIIWNAGDQITIFDGIGNKCIGSLETGAGSSSATFTYEGIDTPEVALYPADGDATFDGTSISFDIPKEQEYCGPNTFGADANPAVAIVSDGKLQFKNVCSVVKVTVTAPFTINQVDLVDLGGAPLWGSAVVGTDGTMTSLTNVSSDKNVISIKSEEHLDFSAEPGTFFFVIPAETLTSGYKIILYHHEIAAASFTNSSSNTTTRSVILDVPSASATKYNLTLAGNANCYIAPVSGIAYKFKPYAGFGGSEVTPDHVAVLWESDGTTETQTIGDVITGVNYADGVITFNRTTKSGNAVIAAYDDANTIIWSWHIWANASYLSEQGDKTVDFIGALASNPTGLLFQHGRKDPFLGGPTVATVAHSTNTEDWEQVASYVYSGGVDSEIKGTLEYAVSHPMTFITCIGRAVDDKTSGDWLYSDDTTVAKFAGHRASNLTLWAKEKTIYDPCPAGWKTRSFEDKIPSDEDFVIRHAETGLYIISHWGAHWYYEYSNTNQDGNLFRYGSASSGRAAFGMSMRCVRDL